ncbi:hypothetical protein S144_38 [Shewanella sp. phage 1/44]|uniref:hypothetical protein n=1 Tax=Shewanella sp. phage 1/44 TaxID=1458862 RepID=UPI0004F91130|nr:hypothetical protein S144_38 [Shewanella sp. phage 1/44]AHK11752.1 hypothetical protein S144_38 [Shewanella sp. phage 1/44]
MQQIDTITPTSTQQLVWLNRNRIKKVLGSTKRASNGALIVQQVKIPSGHSIEVGTLDAWMSRSDFTALADHNENTLGDFTLTLGDDVMQVIWDNTGDVAIAGDDLYTLADGDLTLTNVVMRFLTV